MPITTAIVPTLAWGRLGRSLRGQVGFGLLHAGNTALNMGFTLLQLLVLAHVLPRERYPEIVFLASIGFYVQPFNQAFGKTSFVLLRDATVRSGRPQSRTEIPLALGGQAAALVVLALVIPSVLASPGSRAWVEDVLFLFLSLAINAWAFDLQSTAWAIGRNLAFVKLSIVHRGLHVAALAVGFVTGDFLLFVAPASLVTLAGLTLVLRLFWRAGLFEPQGRLADWPGYFRIFALSILSTVTDFLVFNAPYMLLTLSFGIGPMLIVFDSVMKIARIAMAGSRTLAEIALPRYSEHRASGRLDAARRLFWSVVALCVGASAVPALAIAIVGATVFRLLLGPNNVIPTDAMLPAALVVLASGLYQPAGFFLSYSNRRRPLQVMIAAAAFAIALFFALLHGSPMQPAAVLATFGVGFLGLGVIAAILTDGLFRSSDVAGPAADPDLLPAAATD